MNPAAAPEPWGKLDRTDRSKRLTLVGHCIDVAAVLTALLELPTLDARLARLAGRPLTDVDRERLAVLAFLHDTGKAGSGFYSKGEPPEVGATWKRRQWATDEQFGHTRVVAPLLDWQLQGFEAHADALHMETWLAWWPNAADLWLAAVSHHGQPITEATLPTTPKWPTWRQPIAGYEPLHGLQCLGDAAQKRWPIAFTAPPTPPLADAFTHAFAGLVSLADWIGSNTDHFPYDFAAQDESRWDTALTAARRALVDIGLDLRAQQAEFAARSPSFHDLFDFPPKPMQTAAGTRLDQPLVVLEAETGSGKTEAALWRFAELFRTGQVDALCFLLPTRVAASGIYARLAQFVERAFPDAATRPTWVLAVPGDLRANGVTGKREPGLAFADVTWPDSPTPEERFWSAENSKRYFAAGLCAGTIDQFLLSTLRTGHAHLRAALSLRSLVVVDEVHASDPYMARLLRTGLARHAAAGGHAMLLSATLTGAARSLLLTGRHDAALARPDAPYPCLSHAAGLDDVDAASRDRAPSKRVRLRTEDAMRAPERVAALAAEALARGQRVLVLRNTVGQALATQRALEALLGEGHPALFRVAGRAVMHHGRYARADRLLLDEEVGRCFGKGAAEDLSPRVLVGTQTLEISVDCDADLLITDIAPMDVLLQRLGRLHRHPARHAVRPGGHEVAQAVVLTPPSRDVSALLRKGGTRGLGLGARSAYPNLLAIEATWRELEREALWEIPRHNRALVEACCDEATLQALAEQMGADWREHWQHLTAVGISQRGTADIVTLDWRQPWQELAPGELLGEARTRLGLDAIRIELGEAWRTPLGQWLTHFDIPAWMGLDASQALAISQRDEGEPGVLRFEVGGKAFRYGRLGLELI